MDFQFTSTIAYYLDGPAIGEMFATVFAITNVVAMVVQLFLTSLVMSRFGVGVALCILPFAVLSGSAAMLALLLARCCRAGSRRRVGHARSLHGDPRTRFRRARGTPPGPEGLQEACSLVREPEKPCAGSRALES